MLGQFSPKYVSQKKCPYNKKLEEKQNFDLTQSQHKHLFTKVLQASNWFAEKKTYNCFTKSTPQSSIEVLHLRKIKLLHFKIQSLPNPRL